GRRAEGRARARRSAPTPRRPPRRGPWGGGCSRTGTAPTVCRRDEHSRSGGAGSRGSRPGPPFRRRGSRLAWLCSACYIGGVPFVVPALFFAMAFPPPSAKLVWRTLGENLADAGDPRRAEAALAMALALDDRDAESWAELGRLERRLSRRARAAVLLGRAAALDPQSSAHHHLAEPAP